MVKPIAGFDYELGKELNGDGWFSYAGEVGFDSSKTDWSGLGLSNTFGFQPYFPFALTGYTFKNDKGEGLFTTGLNFGGTAGLTWLPLQSDASGGPFAVSTEWVSDLRYPVLLNPYQLLVLGVKSTFGLAPTFAAGTDGSAPTQLVTGTHGYEASLTFYKNTNSDPDAAERNFGDHWFRVNAKIGDADNLFEALAETPSAFRLAPDAKSDTKTVSFNWKPRTEKNEIAGDFSAEFNRKRRDIVDSNGVVIPGYEGHVDATEKFKVALTAPFASGTKLKLTGTADFYRDGNPGWEDNIGLEHAFGADYSFEAMLNAGGIFGLRFPGSDGRVSLDQVTIGDESRGPLSEEIPLRVGVNAKCSDMSYQTSEQYLHDGTVYDGSYATDKPYGPKDEQKIACTLTPKVELGLSPGLLGKGDSLKLKLSFPISLGEDLTKDNLSQAVLENPKASVVSLSYETVLGARNRAQESQEKLQKETSIDAIYNQVQDALQADPYNLTEDQVRNFWNDGLRTYMVQQSLNGSNYKSTLDGAFVELKKPEFGLYSAQDFMALIQICALFEKSIDDVKGDFAKPLREYARTQGGMAKMYELAKTTTDKSNKSRLFLDGDDFLKGVQWARQENSDIEDLRDTAKENNKTVHDFLSGWKPEKDEE